MFAVLAVAGVSLAWKYFCTHALETDHPWLKRRGLEFIGWTFTLDEPIVNGGARVNVGESQWAIVDPNLAAGSTVRVVGVDGTRLRVDKA